MRTTRPERAASPNERVEHPAWHSYSIQQHVLCSQTLMPALAFNNLLIYSSHRFKIVFRIGTKIPIRR